MRGLEIRRYSENSADAWELRESPQQLMGALNKGSQSATSDPEDTHSSKGLITKLLH